MNIALVATSYPPGEADWQGLFIRKLVEALADEPGIDLGVWAPPGPMPDDAAYLCTEDDRRFLQGVLGAGGIAQLLRARPVRGGIAALGLLRRLRRLYRARQGADTLFHINWLQNAMPLMGLQARAVITVLGTDFKLLRAPGMTALLRRVLAGNRCILAPNASWMCPELERRFGDLAPVRAVPFGIDAGWFDVSPAAPGPRNAWLSVLRVTPDKIGPLFDWGQPLFGDAERLVLVGPNQGEMAIPEWVDFRGPQPAATLMAETFPASTAFITLSQHSEGRPQVLLEALAAGLPIIASDIPAHRDIIEPHRHGYLVDSPESLREAMARVADPVEHARLSAACREDAAAIYGSWPDAASRYRALYEALS
ncbi:MAG: glycosyltransferase family 4 protein [Chromatocurvus sp.]